MSFASKEELRAIKSELKRARPRFIPVAEQYASNKIPEKIKSHFRAGTIATTFYLACLDFLFRDNPARADQYQHDAQILNTAAQILKCKDRVTSYLFRVLMSGSERQALTDLYKSIDIPINDDDGDIVSPLGDQTVRVLERMARSVEIYARHRRRIKKNITFFYCLGARFSQLNSLPLPSATQANEVYNTLLSVIRSVAPSRLIDLKTDYNPSHDGNEIRRLMKAGARGSGKRNPTASLPHQGRNGDCN